MAGATFTDPATGRHFPIDATIWRAPSGSPLMMSELAGIGAGDIDTSRRSLWRYGAALPFAIDDPVTLGEGCTPLLRSRYDGLDCAFKLEWFSPTGSFKDRGASVLVSGLKQLGVEAILEDSSGNGGAAIACYGRAAGMAVNVFVPEGTSPAKIAQTRAYGADIEIIPGPRDATETAAIGRAAEIFYASHNWHPFFLQGTKTLGYEIWEDLGFRVPDNIVTPASAGSNLLGCWLAFTELRRAGAIDRLPRLFAVQPAACPPLHNAFTAGADDYVATDYAPTIAEGTAIRCPVRLPQMLRALRESEGGTAVVAEGEIAEAATRLAAQGLYAEPTSAQAAAGFAQLVAEGRIAADEETVVVLTGSGLKASAFWADRVRDPAS